LEVTWHESATVVVEQDVARCRGPVTYAHRRTVTIRPDGTAEIDGVATGWVTAWLAALAPDVRGLDLTGRSHDAAKVRPTVVRRV
jgi:hypothetical protein